MSTKDLTKVEFSNLLSKILLKDNYRYQFTIPMDKPEKLTRMLGFVEKHLMNIDLSDIKIDRPIFIISLPRTGSTMLQNVISHQESLGYFSHTMNNYYPNFCAVDRLRDKLNLDLKGERFIGDSIIVDTTSASDPIRIWNSWIRKDPFVPKYMKFRKEDLSAAQIEEIFTSIKQALWCFKHNKDATRFLIKSPGMLAYLPLVNDLFPDAKFIHLLRDPRPCANSMIKLTQKSIAQLNMIAAEVKNYPHTGKTPVSYPHVPKLADYIAEYGVDNIKTAAHVWADAVNLVDSQKGMLKNFYEVRYEDILDNPQVELDKIFDFCELEKPQQANSDYWQALKNVGNIQHKNTYSDFKIIEEICTGSMERYGYNPS